MPSVGDLVYIFDPACVRLIPIVVTRTADGFIMYDEQGEEFYTHVRDMATLPDVKSMADI